MSTTYVNPDAPNPEITDAAVRSMLMQNNPQNTMGGYPTTGYYAGAGSNPFAGSQNVMSVPSGDSRANVGYPMQMMSQYQQYPQQYAYNPQQAGIAPPWNGGSSAFNQLTQMNQQALMGQGYQPQPMMGYNGYPIGIDPGNYIFEYMKNHTAPKNVWGENYWTMQKPIEQPPIDWTAKPQPQYVDQYAQYGMGGVPCQAQQPMLPPGFSFPQVQETWLDQAKRNWKKL